MAAEKGNVLFDKLSELKYPNIFKFSPSSFDWLFDNEEALPFLDWFCSSVKTSNVLTNVELERFDNLKKENVTILEGKRLSEALDNEPVSNTKELATEIQELQDIRDGLLNQKLLYINQLNIINLKEKALNKKMGNCDTQNANEETKDDVLVRKLKYKDAMYSEALQSLNQASSQVIELLSKKKLLCQHSFKQYLASEEECTTHLKNFANKQFDQNMGQMGQNSGTEMCAFLQVGNPNFEDSLGLDEKARSFQNWELNRLQFQLLPLAEEDKIVNEMEVSSLAAAIDSCQQIFTSVLNGKFSLYLENSRDHLNSLEQKSSVYERELSSLKDCVIHSTFKATQLRCSSIIVGDCSLKLLRQEFFISKQKELLSLLVQQWAREQLVLLALRLEGRQLEVILSTLKNISQQLLEANHQSVERLDAMKHFIDLEKSLQNRNTIPINDEVSCSLTKILGLEFSPKNIPRNYEDLSNLANMLQKQFDVTKLSFCHLNKTASFQQKNLKHLVSVMEELVFGVPLTSITQKLSNPKCLEENIVTLDAAREEVQCRLKPKYREFKAKQILFKNDHLAAMERRLWTLFYTDINSMMRKSDALNAKANSM